MHHTLRREKSLAATAFFLTLGVAVLLFLPFVIYDRGYFIYYGDFNAQQIPFYQLAHRAVWEGNLEWNWTTDLGANFIGSYSFYMLGSPFFWLTLPFPNAWVPYLMAPLLALKMAFAGLAAFAYTRRFISQRLAVIAALLYAFSGFSVYNIFFNHFHEALIWFPLLLLGVEQYMQEGRRGLFALAVLLTALNNYYFFIAQAIFVMIYWVIRAMSGEWEHCGRRFFGLWLEALLATAGAAVLLLPSYLSVIQNSRTDDLLEGWGFLIHSTDQRLYDIIHSFFFPPDIPARANFFPDANNKWSSMSAWIPLFGCTGAIAYFQSRHHNDWLKRLLVTLTFFALIPGLNAAFQLFNQMYYARWFYMLTLMIILATLQCFDDEQPVEWGRAIGWAGGVTGAIALFIGLMPKSWTPDEETGKLELGLAKYPIRFWVYVGVAMLCLVLTGLLVRQFRRDPRQFIGVATALCILVGLGGGWAFLTLGKATSNYPDDYVIEKLIESDGFTLPESDVFSRMDSHKGMDNQGMYWNMPTIQAFHSIVPGGVMDFYNSVGVTRTVGSRPDSTHYALRSLLSTRWLFDYIQPEGDVQLYYKEDKDYFNYEDTTAMPGWQYYDTQDGFAIYENENFIPMGFAYDSYITRSTYNSLTKEQRELVLLKALVVEDADEDKVSSLLTPLDTVASDYSEEAFAADCATRAEQAATDFTAKGDVFLATVQGDAENWVFFSVPYEKGWSADINGAPTEIIQVNVGFMAVKCPAGQADIRFVYRTPGLRWGIVISAAALFLLAIYWLVAALCWRRRKKAVQPVFTMDEPTDEPLPPANTPAPDGFDLYTIYKPQLADDDTAEKE